MSGTTDVPAILAEIREGLADDGVYVAPELASTVSPDQLAAIVANVADNPVPTFVVLYPYRDGDPFSASPQDLLARLHDAYGEDGLYLSTTGALQYNGDDVDLEARAYGVAGQSDGDYYGDALGVLAYEDHATVGEAAERLTSLLLEPPQEVTEIYEEARSEYRSTQPESGDSPDSDGDGLDGTTLVVALVVAAVVGAVGWAAVRRRRPSGPQTFALPPSAMDRIREAHDRRLEQEARDALLALGEAVDDTEIAGDHDRDAWQAALDHYDAARRALVLGDDPEDPDVLDVVGAIVLARRGREALAAAVAGHAWTATAPCFLNPLHGGATGETRLRSTSADGLPEAVPVCSACRRSLESGKTPDVLDVAHRGSARHYFETDVEPWASTGYGALDLDLVAALQRTRR